MLSEILKNYGPFIGPFLGFFLGMITIIFKDIYDDFNKKRKIKSALFNFKKRLIRHSEINGRFRFSEEGYLACIDGFNFLVWAKSFAYQIMQLQIIIESIKDQASQFNDLDLMISINKCQRSIELLSSLTSEFNNDKDKENKETIETFYKSISSILEDFDLRSEFPYTAPV